MNKNANYLRDTDSPIDHFEQRNALLQRINLLNNCIIEKMSIETTKLD